MEVEGAPTDQPAAGEPKDIGGLDCPYRQASEEQLQELLQLCASDRDAAADRMAEVLDQRDHKQDTRQQLRVTLSTLALNFAQERQFMAPKVGVIFNITQTLLASICRGDSLEECEAVLKNSLAPLVKVHAKPEEPLFTAFDIGPVTQFFADYVLAHFSLFSYVLRVDQDKVNTDVEKTVEVPWIPAFHGIVQTEREWNDALEQRAAAEEEARRLEEQRIREKEEAAEVARIEKEKLDAEFERKKALAAKPEKLEEAVEKLVRWRIESEKRRLVDAYMSEVNVLRTELSAMQSGLDTTGKKGGKAK